MSYNTTTNRIFGFDLLRAAAIIMVVFSNVAFVFPVQSQILPQIFSIISFLGSEIFFVLSGFLIGRILYNLVVTNDFSLKTVFEFLKNRWFKTLPIYFLILLFNVLLAVCFNQKTIQLWRYFFFLQNFKTSNLIFFPESWGLSIIEYAYVILPVTLFFMHKIFPKNYKSWVFITSVSLLLVISLLFKLNYNSENEISSLLHWDSTLRKVLIYRLDSFFIGAFFGWLSIYFFKQWKQFKIYLLIIGVFLFGFLFVGIGFLKLTIVTHPFLWNVLYLPLVSINIALFLPVLSEIKTKNRMIERSIIFVSKISYGIYLLHFSILLHCMKLLWPMPLANNVSKVLFITSYSVLTICMGYFLYRFFEKPILRLRHNKINNHQ